MGLIDTAHERPTGRAYSRLALPRLIATVLAGGFAMAWVCIMLAKWPFTQRAATAALEHESGKSVTIGKFHLTLFPVGYVAENLRFSSGANKDRAAEIVIGKLVVIARPLDLVLMRKKIERVAVSGLQATVPNKEMAGRKPGPPRFSEIGLVQFDDAVIQFQSFPSDLDPLTFRVKNLSLRDMSRNRSGIFSTDFSVNKPAGTVHLSGQIGPWDWKKIERTRISGFFSLPHSNLASFKGIEGSLSASGKFSGPLGHIECEGRADVPDFQVSKSAHSVNLSSKFRASINGSNGDVILEHAESHFNNTVIESQGSVQDRSDGVGKAASLRLSIEEGQLADVLLLFTRAPQPSMAGTVDLRLKVEVPPGPIHFLKKLNVSGDFGIDRGRFTKSKTQAPIDRLSESAAGVGRETRKGNPKIVLSELAGHISAQRGLATLAGISFEMPGSHGVISGTYNLLNQAVELNGRLFTTGQLSSAASGFKALILKIITPLLTKHSVTAVNFTITGTAQHPHFGLDLLKGKSKMALPQS